MDWIENGRVLYWQYDRPTVRYDTTRDAIFTCAHLSEEGKKDKGSPYSITERSVPELIPVLGSQPAGDVRRKS